MPRRATTRSLKHAAGARHPAGAPDGAHRSRARATRSSAPTRATPACRATAATRSRSGYGELESSFRRSDLDLLAAHRRALATAFPSRRPAGSTASATPRRTRARSGSRRRSHGTRGTAADQQLMTLLRRLTAVSPARASSVRSASAARGRGYRRRLRRQLRGGTAAAVPAAHGAVARAATAASREPATDTPGGGSRHAAGHPRYAARLWRRACPAGLRSCSGRPRFDPGGRRRSVRRPSRGAPITGGGPNSRRRRRRQPRRRGGAPARSYSDGLTGLMAVNLIRAHREELIQASTGKLDHMVIDVVGSLFDQILSDSRVPPQMAREIARLQLPVLRVALSDPSFFSTRRHPVRRFINRIASLANAFDDFDETARARSSCCACRKLVDEIDRGRLRPDRAVRRQGRRARELHRRADRGRSRRSRRGRRRSTPRNPSCACSSATCCSCSRRSGRCRCRRTCRSSCPRSGARRWCSRCAATAPSPTARARYRRASAPTW